MCLLDQDLTAWLRGLTGWPYTLLELAGMTARQCGLELENTSVPNGQLLIAPFEKDSLTGRKLMSWCAELAGSYCRATPEGKLRFDSYTPSGVRLTPADYYMGSLRFEDYRVEPVEAVQLRLSGGVRFPEAAQGANTYLISGNPLLPEPGEGTQAVLDAILPRIPAGYTPCTLTCPENGAVQAGQTVTVVDQQGREMTSLVMTKVSDGARMTLRCSGFARRDTSTTLGDQTVEQVVDKALAAQTQQEIFNKLTDNGRLPGLYMHNGQLYINASYLAAGVIQSADGTVRMDLGENNISIDGSYTLGDSVYKTRTELSANGIKSYAEDENGEFVEVLSLTPGGPGQPTQLFNLYGDGLTVLPMAGKFTLGATVTPTVLRGSTIELWGLFEKLLQVGSDTVTLLGKTVGWAYDASSGQYILTGR